MPKLSEEAQSQRRENILDAAELCFSRKGFHATTVQDICRGASVSAGAVYVYFSSKEEIIAGIVARDREAVEAEMLAVAGAPDVMVGLGQLMRTCILERPPHRVALFVEIAAEASRNPAVARAVNECHCRLAGALEGILARARADGRISPSIDTGPAALLLSLLADGMFLRRAIDPSHDFAVVAPHLLGMIEGLLNMPSPSHALSSPSHALPSPSHALPRVEAPALGAAE